MKLSPTPTARRTTNAGPPRRLTRHESAVPGSRSTPTVETVWRTTTTTPRAAHPGQGAPRQDRGATRAYHPDLTVGTGL
ncbi:hypothetical protein QJS66_02055 [Kocuria rhizophila]|nr:hypothetical protein QJS66_02055 [Kocuria rhizophila]